MFRVVFCILILSQIAWPSDASFDGVLQSARTLFLQDSGEAFYHYVAEFKKNRWEQEEFSRLDFEGLDSDKWFVGSLAAFTVDRSIESFGPQAFYSAQTINRLNRTTILKDMGPKGSGRHSGISKKAGKEIHFSSLVDVLESESLIGSVLSERVWDQSPDFVVRHEMFDYSHYTNRTLSVLEFYKLSSKRTLVLHASLVVVRDFMISGIVSSKIKSGTEEKVRYIQDALLQLP